MQPCSSTSTAESRQRRNLSRFPSSVCHLEHLVDAHLSATERDRGEEHDAGERERRMLTTQPGKSTYASAEEVGLALMSPLHLLHPLPTGASATEISSSSRSEVAAKARRRCPADAELTEELWLASTEPNLSILSYFFSCLCLVTAVPPACRVAAAAPLACMLPTAAPRACLVSAAAAPCCLWSPLFESPDVPDFTGSLPTDELKRRRREL
jgi:hypothetical protein